MSLWGVSSSFSFVRTNQIGVVCIHLTEISVRLVTSVYVGHFLEQLKENKRGLLSMFV